MKELKIGERVEVVMFDGSDNAGVIVEELDPSCGVPTQRIDLELPTIDGSFFGLIIWNHAAVYFWECKLKDEN